VAPTHPSPPPTDDPLPQVTVLVTNWNGRAILQECLTSIYAKTRAVYFDVVVVDDASTDDSVSMVRTMFPRVTLVVNPANLGFVGANNFGVQRAKGKYILLLNSDTVLLNDAVSILAQYMDLHQDVGITGAALTGSDGSPQISYGWPPSFIQGLVDAFFLNDRLPGKGLPARGVAPVQGRTGPLPVRYVSGAALMIRTSLVVAHGLFDQRFKAYCEEVDLCRRVQQTGHSRVMFVPSAHILHYEGKSYGQLGPGRIRILYQSTNAFLVKHHGKAYAIVTRLLYAWHYFVKGIYRGILYLLSGSGQRATRLQAVRHAVYNVRYSLWPYGKQ